MEKTLLEEIRKRTVQARIITQNPEAYGHLLQQRIERAADMLFEELTSTTIPALLREAADAGREKAHVFTARCSGRKTGIHDHILLERDSLVLTRLIAWGILQGFHVETSYTDPSGFGIGTSPHIYFSW